MFFRMIIPPTCVYVCVKTEVDILIREIIQRKVEGKYEKRVEGVKQELGKHSLNPESS